MSIIKKLLRFFPSIIRYGRENHRLRKIDYFKYQELINGEYVTPLFFNAVCAYGNYKAVAKLIHKPFCFIRDYLEHGVCFYDTPESAMLMGYPNRFCVKHIYTYSVRRKRLIEEFLSSKGICKSVTAIGPYILGAEHFHTRENLENIKKKYGKILLVYPIHSTEDVIAEYEISKLLDEIDRHTADFDSVFVCLHWRDILNEERRTQFTSRNYTIVSNGLGSDPYFLSRQKDLIWLSNMMMTNGLGTHIGYAICMQRPVYFFQQKQQLFNRQSESLKGNDKVNKNEQLFAEQFCEYSFEITRQQTELVEEYWGNW